MIISRTPLRISLGGGGTDLPFYCIRFGASLITAAINKYIYITVSHRVDNQYKLNYSKTEIIKKIDDINHPLFRECLRFIKIEKPLEIHSVAEIPAGTGLGSSGSFAVGLLNALYYYKGEIISKYKMAEDASHVMMDILKEPCGKQDQYAASFGNLTYLEIDTNGKVIVTPLNISYDYFKKLEFNLMMFYTGLTRSANEILAEQRNKAEKKENKSSADILEYYHKIKKIGKESLKCLENGDLRRFGKLMNTHWEIKRNISNSMSNEKIDEWYALALANGAIGGKIIGAGGGGFLMLYVHENHDRVRKLLEDQGLVYTDFKFDFDGSRIVYDGKHF